MFEKQIKGKKDNNVTQLISIYICVCVPIKNHHLMVNHAGQLDFYIVI